MPPRYAYWTIVAGGLPTAFRAAEREELLPTFKRIQEKHPDAEMKYFARGKLWASQEDARLAAEARRAADRQPDSRGRDWRPGGQHRDPRQKFKDAKRDRNLEWRKERFGRRQKPGTTRGAGAPPRPPERQAWRGRPQGAGGPQGEWRGRPPGASKPHGQWRDRPPHEKPQGDPLRRPTTRPLRGNRFHRSQDGKDPSRPREPDRQGEPGEHSKPASARPPVEPFRSVKQPFRPPGPPERRRQRRGPVNDRRRRS